MGHKQVVAMGRRLLLVMLRIHRRGQGMVRVHRASMRQVLRIRNKVLEPTVVVVCMRYKANFWTCRLEVRKLRRREYLSVKNECKINIADVVGNVGRYKLLFHADDSEYLL
jgi:hypothetical protein